jgi:hypothetical protein
MNRRFSARGSFPKCGGGVMLTEHPPTVARVPTASMVAATQRADIGARQASHEGGDAADLANFQLADSLESPRAVEPIDQSAGGVQLRERQRLLRLLHRHQLAIHECGPPVNLGLLRGHLGARLFKRGGFRAAVHAGRRRVIGNSPLP